MVPVGRAAEAKDAAASREAQALVAASREKLGGTPAGGARGNDWCAARHFAAPGWNKEARRRAIIRGLISADSSARGTFCSRTSRGRVWPTLPQVKLSVRFAPKLRVR